MARTQGQASDGLHFFDSHCHLTDAQFTGDFAVVLKRAQQAGVAGIMTASQSVPDSKQAVALCRNRPNLYCAIGVHPHEADRFRPMDVQTLKDLCIDPKVKAIGEIGLDFFRGISSRSNQETAFHAQIELARMIDMPMVIHVRDAAGRARVIVDEHGHYAGVLHCFSGDRKTAEWATEKGLYISIAGNITYGETKLFDILRAFPRERLMVETDAPFLAPVPERGKRCEPAFIKLTVQALARVLGDDPKSLAQVLADNARRCFRI
jgi:TatD DNase family protein